MNMKNLKKKGGVVDKRGEEETKSMPHAPVLSPKESLNSDGNKFHQYQQNEKSLLT